MSAGRPGRAGGYRPPGNRRHSVSVNDMLNKDEENRHRQVDHREPPQGFNWINASDPRTPAHTTPIDDSHQTPESQKSGRRDKGSASRLVESQQPMHSQPWPPPPYVYYDREPEKASERFAFGRTHTAQDRHPNPESNTHTPRASSSRGHDPPVHRPRQSPLGEQETLPQDQRSSVHAPREVAHRAPLERPSHRQPTYPSEPPYTQDARVPIPPPVAPIYHAHPRDQHRAHRPPESSRHFISLARLPPRDLSRWPPEYADGYSAGFRDALTSVKEGTYTIDGKTYSQVRIVDERDGPSYTAGETSDYDGRYQYTSDPGPSRAPQHLSRSSHVHEASPYNPPPPLHSAGYPPSRDYYSNGGRPEHAVRPPYSGHVPPNAAHMPPGSDGIIYYPYAGHPGSHVPVDRHGVPLHHLGASPPKLFPGPTARPRQQISCHLCRTRKVKCSGGRPCDACIKVNKVDECEYEERVRRRGKGRKKSSAGHDGRGSDAGHGDSLSADEENESVGTREWVEAHNGRVPSHVKEEEDTGFSETHSPHRQAHRKPSKRAASHEPEERTRRRPPNPAPGSVSDMPPKSEQ